MYTLKKLNSRFRDTLKVLFPTYHLFFFDLNLLDIIILLACVFVPQVWDYEEIEYFPYIALVLVIHELGHLIAMKHFGYKKLRMRFIGPLALAVGEKEDAKPKEKLIVFLAGPLPGIVLGFMLLLSFLYFDIPKDDTIYFFLIINGFNLLPLFPLDGGQFFKVLFFEKEKENLVFLTCSFIGLTALQFYIFDFILLIISFFVLFILILDLYLFYLNKQSEKEQESLFQPVSKKTRIIFLSIWCLFFFSTLGFYFNPV
nr:metalloprotease family protein [uncultured Marinifilum sp.]